MGLKDVLVKMKLVEAAAGGVGGDAPAADPPEIAELLRSVPPPRPVDERRLAAPGAPPAAAGEAPSGVEIPEFDEIYRAAGIEAPTHGFTAFKVLEILDTPELAALDAKAKAGALAAFLKMNPAGAVPIGDIVQDAVRRDQALDQFERFLQGKLTESATAADRDNAALQSELDELARRNRDRMEANRRSVDAARERFEAWRTAKRDEERRLAEAVAPFVDGNPVTRSQ